MFAYFGFNSMPYELRPARKAATSVEPVPAMGSSTVSPSRVKNSMNSCAMVSGNLAGCTNTPFLRGGGLWMNHDFWNFNQSLLVRLLSLFFIITLSGWGAHTTTLAPRGVWCSAGGHLSHGTGVLVGKT